MTLAITTFGSGKDIALLHGWRASQYLWQDWAKQAFPNHRVTLIDLPGHGNSPSLPTQSDKTILQQWQTELLTVLPKGAIVLGWSLGGLLAQSIAIDYPEHISALILLASSPCFVQKADWTTALDRAHFDRYLLDIEQDPEGLFKSFSMLQALGSPKPKQIFKQLTQTLSEIPAQQEALVQGLKLLDQLDFRTQLKDITVPTLWLLAEQDAIVPKTLASELSKLQPQANIEMIANCGHLLFLTIPEKVTTIIPE